MVFKSYFTCAYLRYGSNMPFTSHGAEPTTGLDPLSRRRVWETINSLKKDRVVVLTTHNMEEADFLGDNIMVMHGGRGTNQCTVLLSILRL
jgi:ABC-type proline/glycine betaine transport system ATPase subunit